MANLISPRGEVSVLVSGLCKGRQKNVIGRLSDAKAKEPRNFKTIFLTL